MYPKPCAKVRGVRLVQSILMDMKMPVMNGFEATKLIRKFRSDLPIIAFTAYSTIDDKEKLY